jgi:hypothetical protein
MKWIFSSDLQQLGRWFRNIYKCGSMAKISKENLFTIMFKIISSENEQT